MNKYLQEQIRRSRFKLQNPYAHLGADGKYDAISSAGLRDVHEERRLLEDPYAYLDEHGEYGNWPHHKGRQQSSKATIVIEQLLGRWQKGRRFRKLEIAEIATRLQKQIWIRRTELWPARRDISPLEILDPEVALKCIGYTVDIRESLGQFSGEHESFEVAGMIDGENHAVQISRRFDRRIRKFTTAHELGHAVLHTQTGLHRDRALDGVAGGQPRQPIEAEADSFAAYFLLPERQVKSAFKKLFLTECFSLTEDSAFALNAGNLGTLQDHCRTLRDLSRLLADTRYYNGAQFYSLAEQFGVSVESMAIRLEELGLVSL